MANKQQRPLLRESPSFEMKRNLHDTGRGEERKRESSKRHTWMHQPEQTGQKSTAELLICITHLHIILAHSPGLQGRIESNSKACSQFSILSNAPPFESIHF